MKYFKNTELAKLYNVSEKSVRNWVQGARESKLDLQLHEQNDKYYVANTNKNIALIEGLVQKNKKYKNRRGMRVVTPTEDFYKHYNQRQILDIISNVMIHHEIPTQYSYVDGAAEYWDGYANRLILEESPNILNQTIELLDSIGSNVDKLVDPERKINVVDLGPGNGIPIRDTLARLLEQGRLNRYIAIDASQEMLDILERNINRWFDGRVKFEGYVRDFSYERFDDLFLDDYKTEEYVPVNLVHILGATLSNFRQPGRALQNISSSLGLNDLLFYACYLDTPNTRRYFDFNSSRSNQKLRSELILDLLGVDDSLYEVEQTFDEEKYARAVSIRLKVDLLIKFEFEDGGARYVELQKNKPILVWRHWHKDSVGMIQQFEESGYDVMLTSKNRTQEYMVLVSKIKNYNSL